MLTWPLMRFKSWLICLNRVDKPKLTIITNKSEKFHENVAVTFTTLPKKACNVNNLTRKHDYIIININIILQVVMSKA